MRIKYILFLYIFVVSMAVVPAMHASERTMTQEASKVGSLAALCYGFYLGFSYFIVPKKTKARKSVTRPTLSFFNEKREKSFKDRLAELAKNRNDLQSRLSTIAEEEEMIENALASSANDQNSTVQRMRSSSAPSSVSMTEKTI